MKQEPKWYVMRWKFIITLAVVVVLGSCVARPFAYLVRPAPSMGSGPAGPLVDRSAFIHTWITNECIFLGIGDSITAGYGATRGHSYYELLVQNDNDLYPDMKGIELRNVLPNLEIKNESLSYTISEEHIKQQLPRVPTYSPDTKGIIVITSGGNDLIHDYGRSTPKDGALYGCSHEQAMVWKENYRQRLKTILRELKSKFPGGCEIFLCNIYDPTPASVSMFHCRV